MASYNAVPTNAPPSYGAAAAPKPTYEPFPNDDVVNPEDDFKYGETVSQCSAEIKQAFLRKVYSVLFMQILGTTVVGALMRMGNTPLWVMQNSWIIIVCSLGAIGTMIALYFKRQSHPTNLILLGAFTGLESVALGAVVSLYPQTIVLQAMILTLLIFLGLTLFTFQSKYDFSAMGGFLYVVLMTFFFTGLIGLFFPFGKTMDLIYSGVGTLLFSCYILFDTHMILNRMSPDEWVMACISLYLDIINLFLNLLRLLNNVESR